MSLQPVNGNQPIRPERIELASIGVQSQQQTNRAPGSAQVQTVLPVEASANTKAATNQSGRPVSDRPVDDRFPRSPNNAESDRSIEGAVTKLNQFLQSSQRDLEFRFDPEVDRTIVTVLDASTEKVIRQLPSEAALKLAESLQQLDQDETAVGEIIGGAIGSLVDLRT